MKKMISIVLGTLLCISMLAACSGQPSTDSASGSGSPAPSGPAGSGNGSNTYTVGLIQLVEHASLDEIREAFTTRLQAEAAAAGIAVEISYQNAQNDMTLINSICRGFVNDGVDVIVAIATPAAQGAAAVTTDIPIIFSAVTDPIAAGLVEDLQSPGGNITGTSDAIAVDRIFQLAEELTPGIETFGFIYNKGEPNSVSTIGQATEYLESMGIRVVEKTVTSTGEVQQAARALLQECDAVFTPIDNTVATAMQTLANEAIQAQKPVYTAADSLVADGGLATVGVNYTQLGRQTADMALRVLLGEDAGGIPVEVLTDLSVVVNPETAAAIGVDVSKYVG